MRSGGAPVPYSASGFVDVVVEVGGGAPITKSIKDLQAVIGEQWLPWAGRGCCPVICAAAAAADAVAAEASSILVAAAATAAAGAAAPWSAKRT